MSGRLISTVLSTKILYTALSLRLASAMMLSRRFFILCSTMTLALSSTLLAWAPVLMDILEEVLG